MNHQEEETGFSKGTIGGSSGSGEMSIPHPDLPTFRHAVLVFMIGLALLFVLQQFLPIRDRLLFQFFLQVGIFVGVPLWVAHRFQFNIRETFRLRRPGPVGWAAVVIGWVGMFLLISTGSELLLEVEYFRPAPEEIQQFQRHLLEFTRYGGVLAFVALVLTPAICEEFLVRGFFLRAIEESTNPLVAIIGSGILFGLFHLPVEFRMIMMTVFGCFLGALAYMGRSIILTIAIHFLHNATVVYFSGLEMGSGPAPVTFKDLFGASGRILLFLFAGGLVVASVLLARRDWRSAKRVKTGEHRRKLYDSIFGP